MRQEAGFCLSMYALPYRCIEVVWVMNMKKRWRAEVCLAVCGLLVWFLADAGRVRTAAAEALSLCARSVIPALFPFMAASTLLVSMGFGEWLSPHLAGLMALFRLPGTAGSALLLGLVGGYPVGARTAVGLYQKKLLTQEEAEGLLTFCNNSNPVFLISVLGSGLFGSVRTGVWLWLIHILSALLAGLCFRGGKRSPAGARPHVRFERREEPFAPAFVKSVQGAASAMVSVCGFIVFFYILSRPLARLEAPLGPLLAGALELFSVTPLLEADRMGFVIASACAGFGGVSILFQTASALDGSGLRLRPYLLGKLVQAGFAAVLAAAGAVFLL